MMSRKYDGERKFGPPQHIKRKSYSLMLELLETHANIKLTSEYRQDINQFLSQVEATSSINSAMIDLQPEIQWFMRPFLLDFLIELHASFRLQPQTLFLCINIIDRYCAKRIVFKRHYQLVGCTALWIAGKYEDKKSRVPTLRELAMMCRNAYDEEMFVQMEMHILATLEWTLSHPTLEECLQLSITASGITSDSTPCKYHAVTKDSVMNGASKVSAVTAIGRFLCELSLYNKFFMSVPPSLVAITSNLLACAMLQLPNASLSLQQILLSSLELVSHNAPNEDEDQENKRPEIVGPFLSGIDSCTLNTIRKIAIMLVIQLNRITEVLSKKYGELGVIQVVKNFSNRFHYVMTSICEHQGRISEDELCLGDEKLLRFADVLLQLPNESSEVSKIEIPVPLTPPSATSQFSLFSDNASSSVYNTPIQAKSYVNPEKVDELSSTGGSSKNYWSSPLSGTRIQI